MEEKYIKQTCPYDCGPIAIFNILRYFDTAIPFRKYRHIFKGCNLSKADGCLYKDMTASLNKWTKPYNLKYKRIHPSYVNILNVLKNKKGCILINNHHNTGEHYYILLPHQKNNKFMTLNYDAKDVEYIDTRAIKKDLLYHYADRYKDEDDRVYPKCWLVYK